MLTRRLSPAQQLGLLGLLWSGAAWLGWRAFPLTRLYARPLLNLAKLTAGRPAAWFGSVLIIGALAVIYLAGWRVLQHAEVTVSWVVLLGAPLTVALCLFFTYPLTAADLFDYLALGHLAAFHGANPFTQAPAAFASDPFVAYAAWRHFPSAYGPLWEIAAAALARLAAGNLWRGILLMKAQALLSLVLVSALMAWLVRRRQPRDPRAVQLALFLLLWNPLLLLDIAGNAHHDLWMALALLLAVALAERRRFDLALVALSAGALVKLVPLLLLPLFAATAARRLGWRRAAVQLGLGLTLSALLAWLCYRPFWPLADPLRLAQRADLYTTSVLALIHNQLKAWTNVTTADAVTARLGLALLLGLVGLSAWRAGRAPQPLPIGAARLLTAILLLATAWFQTWYLAWVWPLVALKPRARLVPVLLLFNSTAWFKYLLFDLTFGAHYPPLAPYWQQNLAVSCLVIALPLAFALTRRARAARE